MNWNPVCEKHEKRYARNFVLCESYYERLFINEIIMEEFPNFDSEKLKAAIEYCCQNKQSGMLETEKFLQYVENHLKSEKQIAEKSDHTSKH